MEFRSQLKDKKTESMLTTVPSMTPEKYRLSPEKHKRAVGEIAGYAPDGYGALIPSPLDE
jgi:hypothetical protein